MKRIFWCLSSMFHLSTTLHAATAEKLIEAATHTIINTKKPDPTLNHNEDRLLLGDIGEDSVFAVFDGHGGEQVSDMLANGFMQQLEAILSGETASEAKIQTALQQAFFWFHAKSEKYPKQGSTAAVAYYMKKQRKIIVAHAGDSRILVFTPENQSLYETSDHTACSLVEKARLDAAMGFPSGKFSSAIMFHYRGGWRFGFSLAMSRSIGDRDVIHSVLSYSTNHSTEERYEERLFQSYAEPTIAVVDIADIAGPVFLLAASDGLFEGIAKKYNIVLRPCPQPVDSDDEVEHPSAEEQDQARLHVEHLTNNQIRSLVLTQYEQNPKMSEVSKALAEMAPSNASNDWCGTRDDVSVILAKISQ